VFATSRDTIRECSELESVAKTETVLSGAVAAFNPTELKASLEVNYPTYAHALRTTERFISASAESK
jgi:hypothetical protein